MSRDRERQAIGQIACPTCYARAATDDAMAILRASRGRAWDDSAAPLVDLDTADGTVCRAIHRLKA